MLYYKIYFKGDSFFKESYHWSDEKRYKISLSSNFYNTLLLIGIIVIGIFLIDLNYWKGRNLISMLGIIMIAANPATTIGFIGAFRIGTLFGVSSTLLIIGLISTPAIVIYQENVLLGLCFVFVLSILIQFKIYYIPLYYLISCNSPNNPLRWDESKNLIFYPSLIQWYAKKEGVQAAANLATSLLERWQHFDNSKAVKKGLTRLAAEVMEYFSSIQQINSLQQELDFMPPANKMPSDYEAALQDLTEIAEDVKLAYRESNTTNQQRQYERIEQNIQDFQKKSNASKQRSYVQFRLVGRSWLQIIQKEINRLEALHGKPLPNPFVTGPPVQPEDGEVFVGRRDIIEKIQTEALREGVTGAILFTGGRRTGKSSTLLNLNRFLPSSLQAVYFDCQSPKVQTGLLQFCQHIAQEIRKKVPALQQRVLPFDLATLTDWLEAAEQTLQKDKQYLLLCIDEYERLGTLIQDGTLKGLADALRSWVQRFRHLTFLFAGSHELKELSDIDWTDYLINVRTVYISYLDEPAALHLVTKPVPEFDLQYQPDTLPQQLIQRLGRQPYLLQCTLSEMVENLNNNGNRKIAEPQDIDRAVTQVFTTAQQYFEHFWERELDEAAREVLLRLAKGKPVEPDSAAAKRLVRKEVLKRVNGSLVFCVPVLQEWIIENY